MTDKGFVATYSATMNLNVRSFTKTRARLLHPRSCQPRRGEGKPDDDGPGQAVLGQAKGDTIISDWTLAAATTEDETGRVRRGREYRLGPGMADVGARLFVQWQ